MMLHVYLLIVSISNYVPSNGRTINVQSVGRVGMEAVVAHLVCCIDSVRLNKTTYNFRHSMFFRFHSGSFAC